MKVARETLTLTSEERMEFLDITKQIRDAVQKHPISDGMVLVNEINTIPGFTKISMYPKLFEASGLPYSKLIDRLILLALLRHRREKKLKTTY